MDTDARATEARIGSGWRELFAVAAIATTLAVALTYPFAIESTHVGRVDTHDGDFSIWNVAWVARTLLVDPAHLLDANIFFPRTRTLVYSENNIGTGLLAAPAYWATLNPYFAINFTFLLSLVLSTAGGYYLVRYLTQDRRAAALSGICFGFCPYVFAKTSEIQLLMTAGLPFSMLAFHRVVDRPGPGRATVLGLVMAAQAAFCGYYVVFVALMVTVSTIAVAALRGWWTQARYLAAMALAAAVAIVAVAPIVIPYVQLQRASGFHRDLGAAARYSADWRAYFASNAVAHRWLLPLLGRWNEVLFPGFVAMLGGATGLAIGWRKGGRVREATLLYGVIVLLAGWASFGPQAGLYAVLYRVIPGFTLMRAPARFGIVVSLGLAVLAGIAVREALSRVSFPTTLGAVVAVVAAAELVVPLHFREVPAVSPAYRMLRDLPAGPVIELPFWWRSSELHGHAEYMLNSTTHWMPLVNGYSDYIPGDFVEAARTLQLFPSEDAFRVLAPTRAKYAVFHMRVFGEGDRAAVTARLQKFAEFMRPLYKDDNAGVQLYEIVGYPASQP